MKDLIPNASHEKLTVEALPLAISVLTETMRLNPYDEHVDEATGVVTKTFNGRINGQRLRAALGTVAVVERLGDQALRRQAGTQLKSLLKAIRAEAPHLLKKASPKVLDAIPAQQPPDDPPAEA